MKETKNARPVVFVFSPFVCKTIDHSIPKQALSLTLCFQTHCVLDVVRGLPGGPHRCHLLGRGLCLLGVVGELFREARAGALFDAEFAGERHRDEFFFFSFCGLKLCTFFSSSFLSDQSNSSRRALLPRSRARSLFTPEEDIEEIFSIFQPCPKIEQKNGGKRRRSRRRRRAGERCLLLHRKQQQRRRRRPPRLGSSPPCRTAAGATWSRRPGPRGGRLPSRGSTGRRGPSSRGSWEAPSPRRLVLVLVLPRTRL